MLTHCAPWVDRDNITSRNGGIDFDIVHTVLCQLSETLGTCYIHVDTGYFTYDKALPSC